MGSPVSPHVCFFQGMNLQCGMPEQVDDGDHQCPAAEHEQSLLTVLA